MVNARPSLSAQAQTVSDAVQRLVAAAPPLSPAQRARIGAVLAGAR